MRVVLRLLVATMLATLISASALASAATAAPVPLEHVDITIHTEQGTNIMLVAGKLPEGTPLPAQVELPVPAGEVQWAGEILGGDPQQDPEVQYTVRKGETGDVYSFTLTKSLIGQVEIASPSVIAFDGTAYRSELSWTPTTDVASLSMSVRMAPGSKVSETAAGATVVAEPEGYSYYHREVAGVKAGQTESLKFAYTPGAVTPASGSGTSGSNSMLPVLLGFAVVLGIAFLLVRNARAGASRAAEAADDDEAAEEAPAASVAVEMSDAFDTTEAAAPKKTASKSPKAAPKSSTGRQKAAAAAAKQAPAPATKRPDQRVVILAVVAGLIGAFVLISMLTSRGASQTGDKISLTVAQVDTCTTSNFQLTTPPGKDLAEDAEEILATLRYVSGVGNGNVTVSTGNLEVNYCDSSTSEELIRQAVAKTGYLAAAAPGGSGTPTATPAATPIP